MNHETGYAYILEEFRTQKCRYAPEFHTLLTAVFNFVHYSKEDLLQVPDLITSFNKLYPNIRIIAGLPDTLKLDQSEVHNTAVYSFSQT